MHVPTVKAQYAVDEAALGLAMLAAGFGALLGISRAGRWIGRHGAARTTLATGAICALLDALLIHMPSYAALLALMVVFGVVASAFEMAINTEASQLERLGGRPLMSGMHGMFSLGGMAGAVSGGVALAAGMAPAWHLALLTLAFISDDIGGQNGLLMSPDCWRRHLEPRLRRWCRLIHDHGLKVLYHSDGAMEPLIGPLIDCGIDVLNPIQHACPGMDRAALKRNYGHRVIFHGGVDNQFVLPRGTADEVRRETRACLETLGAGRAGYICCSCHNIQPGTPLENILAMVETVQS